MAERRPVEVTPYGGQRRRRVLFDLGPDATVEEAEAFARAVREQLPGVDCVVAGGPVEIHDLDPPDPD